MLVAWRVVFSSQQFRMSASLLVGMCFAPCVCISIEEQLNLCDLCRVGIARDNSLECVANSLRIGSLPGTEQIACQIERLFADKGRVKQK